MSNLRSRFTNVNSKSRPRQRFYEPEKLFRFGTGTLFTSSMLEASSSSALQNEFNLQEFLASLEDDKPKLKDREEFEDKTLVEKHEMKIKQKEQQIRKEFNKSSKLFFCGNDNKDKELAESSKVKHDPKKWTQSQHDQLGKDDAYYFGVKKAPNVIQISNTDAKTQIEFLAKYIKYPVTGDIQGQGDRTAKVISNKDPISSHYAKDISTDPSFGIHQQPSQLPYKPELFEDLYSCDGSLVYRMNSKEKNTLAMPRGIFNTNSNNYLSEVDFYGFKDDEIFFQTKDKNLIITAERNTRNGLNQRKVTECLELPDGIYPENLRISRTKDGQLIIESQTHC